MKDYIETDVRYECDNCGASYKKAIESFVCCNEKTATKIIDIAYSREVFKE